MREILFRGKQKDGGSFDGKWRYGNLVRIKEGSVTKTRIFEKNIGYLVDAETVGQFTGLTDKKGKKIFEGDIVKETSRHFSTGKIETDIFAVEWNQFNFSFRLIHRLNYGERTTYLTKCGVYEVIGNIHDNPELLEELEKCR